MSFQPRLRSLLLCLPLLFGALGGMPIRPEKIEDLMHTMNQQKVMVTVDDEWNNYELPKLPEIDP